MKTMNKKPFIRKIALLLSVLSAVMLFASCGGSEGNGKYGKYEVNIKEFYIEDYRWSDSKLAVIYTFTNNSGSKTTFDDCFDVSVYQNGAALSLAYDAENYWDDIKPGATVEVKMHYYISNLTDDIEIEICAKGKDKVILSKTYSIPESE